MFVWSFYGGRGRWWIKVGLVGRGGWWFGRVLAIGLGLNC